MFENLIYSFSFVLLALALAFKEKLGIEKEIVYTSILALIQLFILGYILITIFSYGIAVAYLLMMIMIIAASFMVYKK